MASRRTKCISTKVTDDEYATLARLAEGQTVSAWVREVLLATATPAARRSRAPGRSPRAPDDPPEPALRRWPPARR